jgi:hypothetical protein
VLVRINRNMSNGIIIIRAITRAGFVLFLGFLVCINTPYYSEL